MRGVVLFEGGPYYNDPNTLIQKSFCLDPEQCYVFTLYDNEGDGICCGYGEGSYYIVNDTGAVLINGGEFDDADVRHFCLDGTLPCNVSANMVVEDETSLGASDGSIAIVGADGVEPYTYSIDGGNSFQNSGVYTNLASGAYNIVVLDYNNCEFPTTINIAEGPNGISESVQRELVVFPNPTNSHLTIGIDQPIENLLITDIRGNRVRILTGNQNTINVENLVSGIYLLHVQVESGMIRGTFVKE